MDLTHIYIETDSTSMKNIERKYGYVLEVEKENGVRTIEGFGSMTGTYNLVILTALIEALGRFKKSCEVYIHTQNIYILNMIENNLTRWEKNGFTTAAGKPLANQSEWQLLWKLANKHLIMVEPGIHSYSEWLQSEIAKWEEKKDV